ncbi:serine hydrolase FSH [Xylaria curta]|nr:serine hydrolase FSH [Xylaria curta]
MGFKVLCLHGLGTNSDIFEAQSAPLRYNLDPDHAWQFEFVNGAYPWPADPIVAEVFGAHHTGLSYFDGSASSALAAIDSLAAHLIQNGPFDCVIGFSMGAAMVATLLLTPRTSAHDKADWVAARPMVRCAVFLCGTLPVDPRQLEQGKMGWIEPNMVSQDGHLCPIDVPTVHVWSLADTQNASASQSLKLMCLGNKSNEILHDAGHTVPCEGSIVQVIADAIRTMLAQIR